MLDIVSGQMRLANNLLIMQQDWLQPLKKARKASCAKGPSPGHPFLDHLALLVLEGHTQDPGVLGVVDALQALIAKGALHQPKQ